MRAVPGARALARGLRQSWERVRPFPLPRYATATPRIGGGNALDPFLPPTALTLGAAAMSPATVDAVVGVLEKLTPIEEYSASRYFYEMARAKYGEHWRYADLLTALWAAASLIQPRAYLEIGMWRGRSAAVVATACPTCAIYGFDLWIPEYDGRPDPGPDLVREELRRVGHAGPAELVSGDSRKTVPDFLRRHPELYFDLLTIDGTKTVAGVASDFAHTLPRLRIGGVVVFDDIPRVPVLDRVWDRVIRRDPRYVCWEFRNAWLGVAVAVRVR